jgi:phosphoribosylanthranilate isomerase
MRGVVKLCGIRRISDAEVAEDAGADFIGTVIEYPQSPRSLSVAEATALARASRVPSIAVVVDPSLEQIARIVDADSFTAVQLAGNEGPDIVGMFRSLRRDLEVWKVLHLSADPDGAEIEDVRARIVEHTDAGIACAMIDARIDGRPGGTGNTVGWRAARAIVDTMSTQVVLAGGLTPENIGDAIDAVRPRGVDVSSGIESSGGIKDPQRMRAFVRAARLAFTRNEGTQPAW